MPKLRRICAIKKESKWESLKRENGYYYLRVNTPGGEKRISLETKDKAFAQDIYQAYLLDRIKKKFIPKLIPAPVSALAENSLSPQSPRSKKPLITLCFAQYLQYCQAKKLSANVMLAKQLLLKSLQKHHIKTPDELSQNAVNRLLKGWGKIGKDSLDVHVKNIKAFLNFCIRKRWLERPVEDRGMIGRTMKRFLSFPRAPKLEML